MRHVLVGVIAAALAVTLFVGLTKAGSVSSTLSVTVAPSSPAPSGCSYGNHGLVRGWAVVSGLTLVADDGCPLIGEGFDNQLNGCDFSSPPLSWWQGAHDQGHNNFFRHSAFYGYWYGDNQDANCPSGGLTLAQDEANLDASVANASASGMYLIIDWHNVVANTPPSDNGCPDWTETTNFWTAIAPRYANNTNVIYQIQNEPDNCGWDVSSVGAQEDSLYQLIRSYAPNTPILLWTLAFSGNVDYVGGFSAFEAATPHVPYTTPSAKAIFDMHGYSGASNFQSTTAEAQSLGIPIFSTEDGDNCWDAQEQWLYNYPIGFVTSCSWPGYTPAWPED